MKIVEFIQRNGQISSGDIQKTFKISRQAAYKEIKKLIELDIIEREVAVRLFTMCSNRLMQKLTQGLTQKLKALGRALLEEANRRGFDS